MTRHFFEDFAVYILVVAIGFQFSGCAVPKKPVADKPPAVLEKLNPRDYPSFFDDAHFDGLEHGISKSLSYLNRLDPDRTFAFGKDAYTTSHLIRSLTLFRQYIGRRPTTAELGAYIGENYLVYRSVGAKDSGKVLFTGYYEPLLRGRRVPDSRFRIPVHARPDDLLTVDLSAFSSRFKGEQIRGRIEGKRFVPYYDRKAIVGQGVLEDKARVLAWLNDPVDLFFLQIQGSGKIYLDDGTTLNVHYHTTNGRPYRSIGRVLIDQGAIPRSEMSMQAIRAHLRDHPADVAEILDANPSYVFFKLEADGPLGCLDVKLTPGRSIATDRRILPSAALVFIQTQKPLIDGDGRIDSWIQMNRFVLNQDTGGAIRGPGRADVFWGNGPYAIAAAGHMQHSGDMYFLVLKPGRH